MIVEQKFLESDLVEIERVFLKSMENKTPILAKKIRICNFIEVVCIIIIFVCSILMAAVQAAIQGRISNEPIFWAVVGVLGVLFVIGRRKLIAKLTPEKLVKRKYGSPFTIMINKETLVYKKSAYLYADIKFIVEYKDFLFIRTSKRVLVMKFNEEEKKELFSKAGEVRVVHVEEPFDIRELR